MLRFQAWVPVKVQKMCLSFVEYARHQSDKNSADPDYLDPSTRNPKSAKRTKLLPLLLVFVL